MPAAESVQGPPRSKLTVPPGMLGHDPAFVTVAVQVEDDWTGAGFGEQLTAVCVAARPALKSACRAISMADVVPQALAVLSYAMSVPPEYAFDKFDPTSGRGAAASKKTAYWVPGVTVMFGYTVSGPDRGVEMDALSNRKGPDGGTLGTPPAVAVM